MPPVVDDFDRADAADLGAAWNAVVGAWAIDGGRAATPSTYGTHVSLHKTAVGGDDQYVEASGVEFAAKAESNVRLLVRHPDDATQTGYGLVVTRGGEVQLVRLDAGTSTSLATETVGGLGAGPMTLRLEVEGDDPVLLRGYWDDVEVITASDGSGDRVTSGEYVGLRAFDDAGTTRVWVGSFEAGLLAAGVPSVVPVRRVRFGGVWHEPSGPVRRVRSGGVWAEPVGVI